MYMKEAQGTACSSIWAVIFVVILGLVYDVWLEVAQIMTCIWNYSHAQSVGKNISVYIVGPD